MMIKLLRRLSNNYKMLLLLSAIKAGIVDYGRWRRDGLLSVIGVKKFRRCQMG
jgi:hypothetical protein